MDNKKTLYQASFDESRNIQGKYEKYVKNSYKQMGIVNVILTALLAIIFFGILFYALGVSMVGGFLNAKSDEINILNYNNVVLAARLAAPFIVVSKFGVFSWIFIWVVLIIRSLLPRWNVVAFSTLGGIAGAVMSLLLFVSLGPILFGFALVGVGWLGILLQIYLLIIFGIRQIGGKLNVIYQNLYSLPKEKSKSSKNFFSNRKLIIIILVIMMINMVTIKVGFISRNFELWSLVYSWLFLLLGLLTIYLVKLLIIKNSISSYYFRKYKDQYKKTWKLTDEQWYGKRKAKKIAKKKIK